MNVELLTRNFEIAIKNNNTELLNKIAEILKYQNIGNYITILDKALDTHISDGLEWSNNLIIPGFGFNSNTEWG